MNTIQYSPEKRCAICNRCFPWPPASSRQTVSPTLQPFLHGSLGDRPTDRPRYSVGSNRRSAQWRSQIMLLSMVTSCNCCNLQQVFIGAVESNTPCQPFLRKRSPDGATPNWGRRHPVAAYYSSIDPEGMKGWVGLVGWPIADGLPT